MSSTHENFLKKKEERTVIMPEGRIAYIWIFKDDGLKIRAIRRKQKITLKEMSEKLAEIGNPISYQALHAIEAGKTDRIAYDNLLAISKILGHEVMIALDIKIAV